MRSLRLALLAVVVSVLVSVGGEIDAAFRLSGFTGDFAVFNGRVLQYAGESEGMHMFESSFTAGGVVYNAGVRVFTDGSGDMVIADSEFNIYEDIGLVDLRSDFTTRNVVMNGGASGGLESSGWDVDGQGNEFVGDQGSKARYRVAAILSMLVRMGGTMALSALTMGFLIWAGFFIWGKGKRGLNVGTRPAGSRATDNRFPF